MERWGQINWTIDWSMNLKIINIHAYCKVVKVCKYNNIWIYLKKLKGKIFKQL
jgi:hypothetical protein